MHTRRRYDLLLSGALTAALLLAAAPAQAEHSAQERLLEDTAYTLQQNEWRIGLWKLQYGVLDDLTLTTYTLPWFIAAANLQAKYQWRINEDWSLAGSLGWTRLNLGTFSDDLDGNLFNIVPIELTGSWRLSEGWTVSSGLVYTKVSVAAGGGVDSSELRGAAAVSNLQWVSNVEWRLSAVTALTLTARVLAFQDVGGNAVAEYTSEDGYTTFEVHGSASTDALNYSAASLTPAVAWAWETFGLRLGLSIGSWNVPLVNFVVEGTSYIPELDLYWRF